MRYEQQIAISKYLTANKVSEVIDYMAALYGPETLPADMPKAIFDCLLAHKTEAEQMDGDAMIEALEEYLGLGTRYHDSLEGMDDAAELALEFVARRHYSQNNISEVIA